MATHEVNVGINAESTVAVDKEVERGPESWAYFYVALGFALSIDGTIIQMITCLLFPYNIAVFLVLGYFTGRLFLFNGWFQNKLIELKKEYETKRRKV